KSRRSDGVPQRFRRRSQTRPKPTHGESKASAGPAPLRKWPVGVSRVHGALLRARVPAIAFCPWGLRSYGLTNLDVFAAWCVRWQPVERSQLGYEKRSAFLRIS